MIFNQQYNRSSFLEFLTNFLPEDLIIKVKDLVVDNKYKIIRSGNVLGECESLGIKIIELEHDKEKDPRISLSNEAFKLMADNWAKRALVVFKSANSDNWRLSFMTISFEINEKNKIAQNLSNPKRKSFYLGPDAKTLTPNNFLSKKGRVVNIVDLESRFDVEVVTNEFFDNYKKLFTKLVTCLNGDKSFGVFANNNQIKLEDFAKKLLGQIVFIYFLQRKGWLGAKKENHINEGDLSFLRNLYINCELNNRNFFNDVLEQLFYNALNKESERAGNFYRDYFDCQIPFLNGGLFEPLNKYDWEKSFLNISNNIFSNADKTGILDVFDLYNFTIDENNTIDQEVSVDPEMLGKVFEKLLETNKETGSFYTPREIVSYMVKQSLIEYLKAKTDINENDIRELINNHRINDVNFNDDEYREISNSLKEIKIIDPAVGSGAFPVGILQEITGIRLICENKISNNQKSAYSIKKEILENNIYGVDIDHGAIDIARLRFWLSLVVEADLSDVEPLPNLDFKLVAANSLLTLKKEEGIWDERDLLYQMKKLREKYFRARTRNGKEKIQNEFNKIIRRSNTLLATDRQKQISTYNPFSPSSVAQFFDSEFMFGVKEFDIVLGNPPYVDSETMVRSGQGELREVYSNLYESANGNWDLFIPFIEKGISLNKNSGTLAFIVPNKLISQNYANKIRQIMISNTIIEIRDYSRISVFLNVDVYPVTFILKKEKNSNSKIKMTKMDDMVTSKESNFLDKDKMTNENWDIYFSDKENISIIEKMNCYKEDLSTLGNFESPCTVSEAYNFKKYLVEGEYADGYKKLINSGTIDKYLSLWGKKDTKYIKDSYKNPIILETRIKEVSARRIVQSDSPKVIIANMTSDIEAFLDLNGDYLAGKSTAICLGEINSLKIITAFLNSRLISFWYKTTFHSTKMAGGALSIAPKKISTIPIPDISDEEKLLLINRVDKILEITANKSSNSKINKELIAPLEKDIDNIVYGLYGLTDKEIENVEKS